MLRRIVLFTALIAIMPLMAAEASTAATTKATTGSRVISILKQKLALSTTPPEKLAIAQRGMHLLTTGIDPEDGTVYGITDARIAHHNEDDNNKAFIKSAAELPAPVNWTTIDPYIGANSLEQTHAAEVKKIYNSFRSKAAAATKSPAASPKDRPSLNLNTIAKSMNIAGHSQVGSRNNGSAEDDWDE